MFGSGYLWKDMFRSPGGRTVLQFCAAVLACARDAEIIRRGSFCFALLSVGKGRVGVRHLF